MDERPPSASPAGPGRPDAFQGLDPRLSETILRDSERLSLPAGAMIFRHGEPADALYLISSGSVLLVDASPKDGSEYVVEELGPGSYVGQVAIIGREPRVFSARTKADAILMKISPARLRAMPDGEALLSNLQQRLSRSILDQYRAQMKRYTEALKNELTAAQERRQYGYFLIFLLTAFAVGNLFSYVFLTQLISISVFTTWEYIALLTAPAVIFVAVSGRPISDFGLTTLGWRKSLTEGLIASAVVFAVAGAGGLIAESVGLLSPPLIHWDKLHPQYVLSSFIQEFMARGILQNTFRRFLDDRKGYLSVVLASVLFSLFHTQFGLEAVALVFASSLAFGAFYLRHQNIIGVTLLHISIGYAGLGLGLFG